MTHKDMKDGSVLDVVRRWVKALQHFDTVTTVKDKNNVQSDPRINLSSLSHWTLKKLHWLSIHLYWAFYLTQSLLHWSDNETVYVRIYSPENTILFPVYIFFTQ